MNKTFLSQSSTKLISAGCILLYLLSMSYFIFFNKVDRGPALIYFITNLLLISIPLILVFGGLAVILLALQQHKTTGQLSDRMAHLVYLTPRIAGIVIAVFFSLFALDVFDMGGTIWQKIGGFIIHAAPASILGLVMFVAWKLPFVGAIVFGLVALYFLFYFVIESGYGFPNFFIFAFPLAIISVLFYVNWKWKLGAKSTRHD